MKRLVESCNATLNAKYLRQYKTWNIKNYGRTKNGPVTMN